MIGFGPNALTSFLPRFLDAKDETTIACIALGVRDAIEQWWEWTARKSGCSEADLRELAKCAQPYLDALEARCRSRGQDTDLSIRRSWLWFARFAYEADAHHWGALPDERREAVLRSANEDLARLRKLFLRAVPKYVRDADQRDLILRDRVRAGVIDYPVIPKTHLDVIAGPHVWSAYLHPPDAAVADELKYRAPWEEFEWHRDHFQTCTRILYRFGGVWRGMKPLLLALRSLDAPAVAADLRYWGGEADRPNPPEPWCEIPSTLINLFHQEVGREQAIDPTLERLRGDVASFCLERLVDRWTKKEREDAEASRRDRTNDDMRERSPIWRLCCIRALTSLGINPEGKGHRVLHIASKIDPDQDVRDAARQAYERFRRGISLPENVSPRRAIMSALWWFRQAHILDLKERHPEMGIYLDADGAQRTRTKELTRTKEIERDNKPVTDEKA